MKINVPAIDGIPGIMPGTIKVPPPPDYDGEEVEDLNPQYQEKKNHFCRGANIPKHKRRMMPCDRMEKSE